MGSVIIRMHFRAGVSDYTYYFAGFCAKLGIANRTEDRNKARIYTFDEALQVMKRLELVEAHEVTLLATKHQTV